MFKSQLSLQEATAANGQWFKTSILHSDLTDTDTAQTIELVSVPAGAVVREVVTVLVTGFDSSSDASINSLVMEVGDTDVDRLVDGADLAMELASDGTEITQPEFGTYNASTATLPYQYDSADTVDATFTVAGGGTPTLAELDSGQVDVYVKIDDFSDFAAS